MTICSCETRDGGARSSSQNCLGGTIGRDCFGSRATVTVKGVIRVINRKRPWGQRRAPVLLLVGNPYLGITSGWPVIRHEEQMAHRSWRQLHRRLAGLGKNLRKHPSTS